LPTTIPAAAQLTPLRRALNMVRANAGIPAAAVARHADISPSLLSMIASGAARATPDVAERIAAALGLPVEDLFPRGES
jgi:transcriptional regulator with XRE-family HTH domain